MKCNNIQTELDGVWIAKEALEKIYHYTLGVRHAEDSIQRLIHTTDLMDLVKTLYIEGSIKNRKYKVQGIDWDEFKRKRDNEEIK